MNYSKLPLTQPPEKICILRLSAIGDITHALLVVRALQRQWPGVEITWVCGKFEYKLLRLIQGVRFIVFDKKAGMREYFRLWKALKGESFDILMHMQVAARANIASLCIRAKIRLGWDRARSRDLHHLFINHQIESVTQQHQVEGFLAFARAVGVATDNIDWDIPVTEKAQAFASRFIETDKPLLVISACSSHRLRNWSAERYAVVADYAIEKYGMRVILSGGPADIEVELARDIQARMQHTALNLVAKDTLEELVGLLAQAKALISPDSGPAHIANALGISVIGLYACTWSRRSGPYGSLQYSVDKFDEAARTFLGEPAEKLKWGTKIERPGVMDLITVEDVEARLDQIMSSNTI